MERRNRMRTKPKWRARGRIRRGEITLGEEKVSKEWRESKTGRGLEIDDE